MMNNMTDTKKARTIPASRELQSRIGTGSVNEAAVEKAQNVLESNDVDFAPMAKIELDKVTNLLKEIKAGEVDKAVAVQEVALPIMNLKANAATFNYPVISSLAGTVLSLIEEFDTFNDDLLKIVDNMQKAILVALMQDMRGEAGEAGKMLVKEFQNVCRAYLLKAKSN
jgi:hypothetical protein